MMPCVASPTESDLQYVVGRDDSRSTAGELGHLLLFLLLEKAATEKQH